MRPPLPPYKIFLGIAVGCLSLAIIFAFIGWGSVLAADIGEFKPKEGEKLINGIAHFTLAGFFGGASLVFIWLVRIYKPRTP